MRETEPSQLALMFPGRNPKAESTFDARTLVVGELLQWMFPGLPHFPIDAVTVDAQPAEVNIAWDQVFALNEDGSVQVENYEPRREAVCGRVVLTARMETEELRHD